MMTFFADLGDSKQAMNGHDELELAPEQKESNGHGHVQQIEIKKEYDRMPDLKMNSKQSLMKLTSAVVAIESSESDEFDEEPLVFAAAKPKIEKIKSPKIIKPKIEEMEAINMANDEDKNEKALNELMEDLETNERHKSLMTTPQSIIKDELSENEEA